ncbi:hypothetical protein K7432_006123 [Basidiobolus ranarum]|uniref:Uncharacterized protein n=1 Tax=Basidiobolus ranarum TaxID=34480 RepID=A0ABR2WVD8_9FUNG
MSLVFQWLLTVCHIERSYKIQRLQVNEATPEDWEEWLYLQADGSLGKLPEVSTAIQDTQAFPSNTQRTFTLADYAKLEKLYQVLQESHVDVTGSYLAQLKDQQQKIAKVKSFRHHTNLDHYKPNTRSSGATLRGH